MNQIQNKNIYDLCPKCGAVSKDGTCQSCGYHNKISMGVPDGEIKTKKMSPFLWVGFIVIFFAVSTLIVVIAFQAGKSLTTIGAGIQTKINKLQNRIITSEIADEDSEVFSSNGKVSSGESGYLETDLSDTLYYEAFQTDIDPTLDYTIKFLNKEYLSEDGSIVMHGNYPVISGDIQNKEDLNDYIEETSLYVWNYYMNELEPSDEKPIDWYWEMNSYVTFTSVNIISIVIEETWSSEESWFMDITSINIDVQSGLILENSNILNIDEAFVAEFIEKSSKQNGDLEVMDYMSPYELVGFLDDPTTNIIFYTPLGMEIGFRYTLDENMGWVTVTYRDYMKYLKMF